MKRLIPLIFALGVCAFLRPAAAEEVTLNFSDADLVSVINSVSQITGKNFIIDPRVKGKINVVSSKPLNEEEVYNVFLSILQVHGFATIPADNAIKIIPDATAKQSETPSSPASRNPGDQLITRVLQVNYINAAQLVPILRPLVAQQGHLAAYPSTNVLIISDRAANISRIARIVGQMDKKTDSGIEIIKLENAFAAEVVRLLSSLNVTTPEQKAQGGGVAISADERTNSVLISGERSERLRFRAIIADLDSPVASTGNTHVIYLRYAEAKDVAELLNSVGQEVIKSEAKNVIATGGAGGAANENTVNVQADEASNALVITAPASIFPSLRAVIQQLDIRRAQVHIEAIIAEVSLDTSHELGVQWLGSNDNTGAFSVQFSGVGATIPSIANGGGLPDGGTLGLGTIDDDGLSIVALISALAGDSETNLLSTPSLVTVDNQEAEIIVGQNVPFVTGETTSSGNDVTNPFRTIERQDVGVSLKVKPQINEGDAITMEIEQEVSNIAGSATNAVDIVTNKRSIKTTVQLEDGALLVLGGLIDETVIDSEQKVPGLGDIPVLGALFRFKRSSKVKQNLLVFIRATIIKDPEKAHMLSRRKYNFMRDLQLEAMGGDLNQLSPALLPFEGEVPELLNDNPQQQDSGTPSSNG